MTWIFSPKQKRTRTIPLIHSDFTDIVTLTQQLKDTIIMNSMYGNHNKYDGGRKPATQTSYSENERRFRIAVTAIIVNLVMSAIMIVLSYLLISSPESREIYTKFLFIPVSAFAGAFVSFLFHKELLINATCNGVICLILHLIFVDVSFWALLWKLFYLLNAFVGFLAALVVRTFH